MPRSAAIRITALAALAALAGCTATGQRAGPVDVTRYHLNEPVAPGTIALEPLATSGTVSPEYRIYADAVGTELEQLGFVRAAAPESSDYVVGVAFRRASRGVLQERPPVTIGVGGGSYGGGGIGLGGGVSFGVGGGEKEVILSELSVQLRRRTDDTVIWEGRAQGDSLGGAEGVPPIVVAERLADALFRGFPGESGITITVP